MKELTSSSDFLLNTGISENTIKAYLHDVERYSEWYLHEYELPCTDLSRERLLAYLEYLEGSKALSPKTINRIISSLIKYNKYLVASGVQTSVVLNRNDYHKCQPTHASLTNITENEIIQLLLDMKKSGNLRNYALAVLMANTGMRISEALNMKMADLNLNEGNCVIRSNK